LHARFPAVHVYRVSGTAQPDSATQLFRMSIGMFFIGGFLSSAISLFVPRMTLVYGLDYARALLVQLAFHTSYLLFAVPIAIAIIRMGYMRSAATGLAIMAISCVLFLWAHGLHSYGLVLFSLLALSAGLTFLQIAANTVVTVVGNADRAAFRLNLLQAFNSIGTVVAPLLAAQYVLGDPAAIGLAAIGDMAPPFLFAILILGALAASFFLNRALLARSAQANVAGARLDWAALFRDRRLIVSAP